MLRAVFGLGLTAATVVLAALPLVPAGVVAQQQVGVEFTDEFLHDPAVIKEGEVIWKEQCRLCHGQGTGYPGKAPKLQPRRYKPEFVYHRVTKGFRGMPGWEDVYSDEQRMAVTAYILSRDFAD